MLEGSKNTITDKNFLIFEIHDQCIPDIKWQHNSIPRYHFCDTLSRDLESAHSLKFSIITQTCLPVSQE